MQVLYIRLKNGDDIIAHVEDLGKSISVSKPMRVFIQTYLEEARQTVILDEYLPQKLIEIKSIELPKEEILFITPLSKGFLEDYETISTACYDPEPEKPKQDTLSELPSKNSEKIVSLFETIEALKSKRGKLLN